MADALTDLKAHCRECHTIDKARRLLEWDMEVMMPSDAIAERPQIMSTLSALIHRGKTDPRIETWLMQADKETNDPLEKRNLALIAEDYRVAKHVPETLIKKKQEAISHCVTLWQNNKASSNWHAVLPALENVFTLGKEQAVIMGDVMGCAPYDALLKQYARGSSMALIDPLFGDLQKSLPPLLQQIMQQQRPPAKTPPMSQATQEKLVQVLAQQAGFSLQRGRIDIAAHPFSGGTKYDARITMRYVDGKPLSSILGTLHEVGHALYTQNTPQMWDGLPIGADSDLSIHESQSLFLERMCGYDRSFLEYIMQQWHAIAPTECTAYTVDDLQNYILRVEADFIRVEANEVTYPLHVLLRYNIEKALFSGDVAVADIPAAWHDGMKDLLGIVPPDHAQGCMQDIHWFWGLIGYFPTYTQGALYAAQIFKTVENAVPHCHDDLALGEFKNINQWLNKNIHQQGSIFDAPDLINHATGTPPSAQYFIDHLRARYLTR